MSIDQSPAERTTTLINSVLSLSQIIYRNVYHKHNNKPIKQNGGGISDSAGWLETRRTVAYKKKEEKMMKEE